MFAVEPVAFVRAARTIPEDDQWGDTVSIIALELDAIDGTPVIDIKPVIREFLPRGELRQPAWASELMAAYWVPTRL